MDEETFPIPNWVLGVVGFGRLDKGEAAVLFAYLMHKSQGGKQEVDINKPLQYICQPDWFVCEIEDAQRQLYMSADTQRHAIAELLSLGVIESREVCGERHFRIKWDRTTTLQKELEERNSNDR